MSVISNEVPIKKDGIGRRFRIGADLANSAALEAAHLVAITSQIVFVAVIKDLECPAALGTTFRPMFPEEFSHFALLLRCGLGVPKPEPSPEP